MIWSDDDFRYLEDLISRVKDDSNSDHHVSDYIEAILSEFQIKTTEEWEALIAEAKELQRTLKRVLEISSKWYLLER